MCSLLSRWDDEEARTTILFVTDEEALFYEPDAPIEVKRFVVTAIRNSMLEIAESVSCGQFKMPEALSDEKIRIITSSAITYFRQCKFEILREEAGNMEFRDVYGEAMRKYPLAWEILKKAASMTCEELVFEGIENPVHSNLDRDFADCNNITICDGYSLEFDDNLKEILEKLLAGVIDVFYTDCFKMLTRNFEKILHVLQIIFENNKVFVTCNYYICNGAIEKRKVILRAAHGGKDVSDHIRNGEGMPPRLRRVLEEM